MAHEMTARPAPARPAPAATQRMDVSAIREFGEVLLTSPVRLCFIVEERYENDVMPGAVVDVLRSCGHHVDVLRPNGTVTDLWELLPTDVARYDAFVLKTVSEGPGLSLLDAAAAAGVTTVNDYRAIRLARDKAVAAVRARAAGIPFRRPGSRPRRACSTRSRPDAPLVVKPNSGSALKDVYRVDSPDELARLDIGGSHPHARPALPAQPRPRREALQHRRRGVRHREAPRRCTRAPTSSRSRSRSPPSCGTWPAPSAGSSGSTSTGSTSSRPPTAGSSWTSTTSPASARSRRPPGGWPAPCCG